MEITISYFVSFRRREMQLTSGGKIADVERTIRITRLSFIWRLGMASSEEAEKKKFSLHWGSGVVEEEVQISTRYHRPTIQLLKFLEGEAAGTLEIRFCHYDHNGRFQRSPLIINVEDLQVLRNELEKTPQLKHLLAQLAA